MGVEFKPEQALRFLHDVSLGLVRDVKPDEMPDFTLRQLTILLTVYLEHPPHTVRGLARKLDVTKPDITRAQQLLGWKPEIELEEGLRLTLASLGRTTPVA